MSAKGRGTLGLIEIRVLSSWARSHLPCCHSRIICELTVRGATRGLLLGYWQSQRRLLRIKREHPPKQAKRPKSDLRADLHRPTWQNEVSREFWRRLDPAFLFWSDPLPAEDSAPLSQEL